MTLPSPYPGSQTTAAAAPGTSPATTSTEAPTEDETVTLFVVTATAEVEAVDLTQVAPFSPRLSAGLEAFGAITLVHTPDDLDTAEAGDHVTYAADWRSVDRPVDVVARVLDLVRETQDGITYDVV